MLSASQINDSKARFDRYEDQLDKIVSHGNNLTELTVQAV